MHTASTPAKQNDVGHTITPCNQNRLSWVRRLFMYFTKEGRSIRRGLKQAEMIHAGKLKGKSFDSFLNEI